MRNNSTLQKTLFLVLKLCLHISLLFVSFVIAGIFSGNVLGMFSAKIKNFYLSSMINEKLYNTLTTNLSNFWRVDNTYLNIGIIILIFSVLSIFIIVALNKLESKNKFKDYFKTSIYYIYAIINPFYFVRFLYLNIKLGFKNRKIGLGITFLITVLIYLLTKFSTYIPEIIIIILIYTLLIGYIFFLFYHSISKENYSWKNILLGNMINIDNIKLYWKNLHLAFISSIYIWLISYLSAIMYILFFLTINFLGENSIIYMNFISILVYIILVIYGIYSLIYFIPSILKQQYKKIGVLFVISIIIWLGSFKYISIKFFNNDLHIKSIKGQIFDFKKGAETNYFLFDILDIEKLVERNTGMNYVEINKKLNSDKYALVCGNFKTCKKENLDRASYLFSKDKEEIYKQQKKILESKNEYNAYEIYALGMDINHIGDIALNNKITENIIQIKNKKIIPTIITILTNIYNYKYDITSYKNNIAEKVLKKKTENLVAQNYDKLTEDKLNNVVYRYSLYNQPSTAKEIEKVLWKKIEKKCSIHKDMINKISQIELNKILEKMINTNPKCKDFLSFINNYYNFYYKNIENGHIKGSIKVLDENNNKLIYGKDYELVLYRRNKENYYNKSFYSQNLDINRISKIVSEEVKQSFDISGINISDTYIIVPIFKKDFDSYKFLKGNIKPIVLNRENSNFNYGNIILQINPKIEKAKKIKQKNYYYLINYNNELINLPKNKILELTDGYLCIYGQGSTNKFIEQEDCKYNKLLGIRYLFDFDNMKYIEFSLEENNDTDFYNLKTQEETKPNTLFIGEGKIFTEFAFFCKEYKKNCKAKKSKNLECCKTISENKKIEYFTEWKKISENKKINEIINTYFIK